MRAMITDIDIARHINNGMYFSLFDLGRFELMVRSGAWDVMRRNKWTPVVQAETITFRKSVVFNQKFTQETRILGFDERCIYFEQRMVADGEIYAQATIATRLLSPKGPVANEEIIAAVGETVPVGFGAARMDRIVARKHRFARLPPARAAPMGLGALP